MPFPWRHFPRASVGFCCIVFLRMDTHKLAFGCGYLRSRAGVEQHDDAHSPSSAASLGQLRRTRRRAARDACRGKLLALEKRVQQLEAENALLREAVGDCSASWDGCAMGEADAAAGDLVVYTELPTDGFYGVVTAEAAAQTQLEETVTNAAAQTDLALAVQSYICVTSSPMDMVLHGLSGLALNSNAAIARCNTVVAELLDDASIQCGNCQESAASQVLEFSKHELSALQPFDAEEVAQAVGKVTRCLSRFESAAAAMASSASVGDDVSGVVAEMGGRCVAEDGFRPVSGKGKQALAPSFSTVANASLSEAGLSVSSICIGQEDECFPVPGRAACRACSDKDGARRSVCADAEEIF